MRRGLGEGAGRDSYGEWRGTRAQRASLCCTDAFAARTLLLHGRFCCTDAPDLPVSFVLHFVCSFLFASFLGPIRASPNLGVRSRVR